MIDSKGGECGLTYFAYGSNMLRQRLRARCPSARRLAVARLHGHRLAFDKRSWRDNTGKCRIEETGDAGDLVWGVLYDLDASDLTQLDRAEGAGNGHEIVTVDAQVDGTQVVPAFTYQAEPGFIDASLVPYDWYVELVVAGAKENGLPPAYVRGILSLPTIPDADPARAKAARSFLPSADR